MCPSGTLRYKGEQTWEQVRHQIPFPEATSSTMLLHTPVLDSERSRKSSIPVQSAIWVIAAFKRDGVAWRWAVVAAPLPDGSANGSAPPVMYSLRTSTPGFSRP